MRSPLLGLFAALAALTPGGLFGATPPASVVLDLPTRERDRPLDHTPPQEHLAPVVTAAPEPVEPPPPAGRTHTIWCPSCSGRLHGSSIVWDGYHVVRPCVTCDGSGKLTVAIAPPFVAKMTRQLQRAAHRAIAHQTYTLEALRGRGSWTFTRRTRQSMARGMVRTNFNFYGVQLPAEEVLRAL